MRLPLNPPVRITSKFGSTSGRSKPHSGTDMVSDDPNVYAIEGGRAELRYDSVSGYGVNVFSGNRKWEYLHLNKAGRASGNVSEGQRIGNYKPGSGKITGPHLHLGLQIPHNGPQQDGYAYIQKHGNVEEMITSNDVDILRIVNSEVKGWNFDEVHSGKYDSRELGAWKGLPITRLIREGWNEGKQYREAKRKTEQKIADLTSQLEAVVKDRDMKLSDKDKVYKELSEKFNKAQADLETLKNKQPAISEQEIKKPSLLEAILKLIFRR